MAYGIEKSLSRQSKTRLLTGFLMKQNRKGLEAKVDTKAD